MPNLKKLNNELDLKPSTVKHILIVKQHNQLGDMLCTYPLFAVVKKKFPNAKITLIASKANSIIISPKDDFYIDELILFEKFTPLKLARFLFKLRKNKYDIAFVPSTVSFSKTSHLIAYHSGAKIRAGIKSSDEHHNRYEKYLTHKLGFKWNENKTHQSIRILDLIKVLNFDYTNSDIKKAHLNFNKEEIRYAEHFFENNFQKHKISIGFHPGAGKAQNRWALDNFESLILKLKTKFNFNILISSGRMDTHLTNNLKKRLKEKGIESVILKDVNIRKEAAIWSKLNLYITNDTGTMHVAGYSGAKVLSLFGPTHGYEWAPLFNGCEYIQSPTSDVNDIRVDSVFNNTLSLLKL